MRTEKQYLTNEYVGWLKDSPYFLVVNYRGLAVGHFNELRKRLAKVRAQVHVVENSAFRFVAIRGCGCIKPATCQPTIY
ncbi:MAG: 50S ribosomal protein L10 [Candidatus Omnitrophica bacterium]|nr:50S ribosomal protein L10 [Candidatus Omnitrophota bacterium]